MLALGQSIYKEPEVLPTNTCLSTKMYVFQTGITMHLVRHSKLFKISYVNLFKWTDKGGNEKDWVSKINMVIGTYNEGCQSFF